jgi:hypothetical protein
MLTPVPRPAKRGTLGSSPGNEAVVHSRSNVDALDRGFQTPQAKLALARMLGALPER